MKFAAIAETNRQVIDLKAKRFLDQADHLFGAGWKLRYSCVVPPATLKLIV